MTKDIVQENQEKADHKQKEWYDQMASELDMEEGS